MGKKITLTPSYALIYWDSYPGEYMRTNHTFGGVLDPKTANLIYKQWKTKHAPQAINGLRDLIRVNVIKPVHLMWYVKYIFYAFMEEKIELYQLQREFRDKDLDEQWQTVRLLISENCLSCFNMQSKESKILSSFIKNFSQKLNQLHIEFEKFNFITNLWITVLKINQIADMKLMSLLDKETKSPQTGIINFIIINNIPLELYRENFVTFSKHLISNANELIQKFKDELLVLNNDTDSGLLKFLYEDLKEPKKLTESYADLEKLENSIAILETLIFKRKFSLQKVIQKTAKLIAQINDQVINDFSGIIYSLKMYINGSLKMHVSDSDSEYINDGHPERKIIPDHNNRIDITIEEAKKLLPSLEQLQKMHLQIEDRIGFYIANIESLTKSFGPDNLDLVKIFDYSPENYGFSTHKNKAKAPSTIPSAKPIKNTPPKKTKSSKKSKLSSIPQKKINNNNSNNTSKKSEKIHSDEHKQIIAKTFMESIYDIQKQHPYSAYLEQALWHLERMYSLNQFLLRQNYSLAMKDEQLNALNAMVSFAHKFLEQLYNFNLVLSNQEPTEEHNLKLYHASDEKLPAAVDLLYNANTWTNYFYKVHTRISSLTTQEEEIPLFVKYFVTLESGQGNIPFQQQVQNIFTQAIEHGSSLLALPIPKEIGLPENIFIIPARSTISLELLTTTLEQMTLLSHSLDLNPNHPVQVHLKQAIAALKMLHASLKTWNTAENHMELVTWTTWSLHQIQEAVEHCLRAYGRLNKKNITSSHELKLIAQDLGIDMGTLSKDLSNLSYTTRYLIQYANTKGRSSKLIKDVEALRHHPEYDHDFNLSHDPHSTRMLKRLPKKKTPAIGQELMSLVNEALTFLNTTILPLRQKE